MAVYKVAVEVVLLPYKYVEETGEPVDHNTTKADMAVDERNKPKTAMGTLPRGTYIYQSEEDFNGMTEEQREGAFFCDVPSAINRYLKKDDKWNSEPHRFGSVLEAVETMAQSEAKVEEEKPKRTNTKVR